MSNQDGLYPPPPLTAIEVPEPEMANGNDISDIVEGVEAEEEQQVAPRKRRINFGAMASKAERAAGSALGGLGAMWNASKQAEAQEKGHAVQTIMTEDGPALVETEPELRADENDELADLFDVPHDTDNDMYTDDLVSPAGDPEVGLDEEDVMGGDLDDVLTMNEPLTPPPGRRIVRVISRPRKSPQDPALGGLR